MSIVRKAQVIGALVGALITIGMPLILKAYDGGQLVGTVIGLFVNISERRFRA